jgi:hypothetical protein
MLIWLTEIQSKEAVAVNPQYVVSVLKVTEGEHIGKTAVVMQVGNLIVEEELLEVVGSINGELNNSCCK